MSDEWRVASGEFDARLGVISLFLLITHHSTLTTQYNVDD